MLFRILQITLALVALSGCKAEYDAMRGVVPPTAVSGMEVDYGRGFVPYYATGAAVDHVRRDPVVIRIPLSAGKWRDPAVLLTKVRHRFVAYVEDVEVYRFGNPNDRTARSYIGEPPHLVPLPADFAGKTLKIVVSSKESRVGLDGVPLIGSRPDLLFKVLRRDLRSLVFGIIPLFLGGTIVTLFLLAIRARLALSFGMFCLTYGLYLVCHSPTIYFFVPYPLAWDHLQYFATYLAPFFFLDFAERAVDGFKRPHLFMLRWGYVALAPGAVLGSLTGLAELNASLPFFQALLLVTVVLLMVEVAVAARAGSAAARVFAAGSSFVAIGAVNDVLVEQRALPWTVEISDVTIVGFILALAILLARKMSADAAHTFHLEKDLETAGILQSRFLQEATNSGKSYEIETLARSAARVGGDWYVYRLVDNRFLHVHDGDVTGHGTRAALLAAFARGAIDLYYHESERRGTGAPAIDSLHTVLNKVLCEMGKDEATMTVASVAIDLQTGELEYVNSGHLAPLICGVPGVKPRFLQGRNSNYLGLDMDFESKPPQRGTLSANEVLLLYSDGVYELFQVKGDMNGATPTRRAQQFLNKTFTVNGPGCPSPKTLLTLFPEKEDQLLDDVTLLAVKLKPAESELERVA